MLTTLAIQGYRSLHEVRMPLAPVTLVTGGNGSGKSSLYQGLRLLAGVASGRLIGTLAREGGLERVLWAGPETISAAMRRGEVPVQGTGSRSKPISLQLGFASDELGYQVDIGLPVPHTTAFTRDPVLKRESLFAGPVMRPASTLVQRKGRSVLVRDDAGMSKLPQEVGDRVSMLSLLGDPVSFPEVLAMRRMLDSWRFYDAFRTDPHSPARAMAVGTWTPVMADDGSDLAPALLTIAESAWAEQLQRAVGAAFEGASLGFDQHDGRIGIAWHQPGLLRPLNAAELSDGTLRFLLLLGALLTPEPPGLLVLNEPETSLHPQVLPVLADLIVSTAKRCQVIVVSHSDGLVTQLARARHDDVLHHHLVTSLGQTRIEDQGVFSTPQWNWGNR